MYRDNLIKIKWVLRNEHKDTIMTRRLGKKPVKQESKVKVLRKSFIDLALS